MRPDQKSNQNTIIRKSLHPARTMVTWALAAVVALAGLLGAVTLFVPPGAEAQAPGPQGVALGEPATMFYPGPQGPLQSAPSAEQRGVSRVIYSPDGTLLTVGTPLGVFLYEAPTLSQVLFIDTGAPVVSLGYSPDGTLIATGSYTGTVDIWDSLDGAPIRSLSAPQGAVNALAFSPDGATLATAGSDGMIRVWRVVDGRLLRSLRGHAGAVWSIAFSPNGQLIASGGADGSLRVWQTRTGVGVSSLVGNIGGVNAVAFSPNSALVALGSGDGAVRLWDVRTGQVLQTLTGHRGGITGVQFAPDGSGFASGSYDGRVIIWQTATGRQLGTLQSPAGAVASVVFSPDALQLVVGALDGAVQVWEINVFGFPRGPGSAFPPPQVLCTNDAAFVADVTVPDNTVVLPGTRFAKTWRFRNTGTCSWGPGYRLRLSGGQSMGSPGSVSLVTVPPGGAVDISSQMIAPVIPGVHVGFWQMADATGQGFGPRVTVVIQVQPPAPPPTCRQSRRPVASSTCG